LTVVFLAISSSEGGCCGAVVGPMIFYLASTGFGGGYYGILKSLSLSPDCDNYSSNNFLSKAGLNIGSSS
jgi:hypothetical protein